MPQAPTPQTPTPSSPREPAPSPGGSERSSPKVGPPPWRGEPGQSGPADGSDPAAAEDD